jgi:hypothetical protein
MKEKIGPTDYGPWEGLPCPSPTSRAENEILGTATESWAGWKAAGGAKTKTRAARNQRTHTHMNAWTGSRQCNGTWKIWARELVTGKRKLSDKDQSLDPVCEPRNPEQSSGAAETRATPLCPEAMEESKPRRVLPTRSENKKSWVENSRLTDGRQDLVWETNGKSLPRQRSSAKTKTGEKYEWEGWKSGRREKLLVENEIDRSQLEQRQTLNPRRKLRPLMRFRRGQKLTPTNSASSNRKGNCSDPAKSKEEEQTVHKGLKTWFFYCNPNKIWTLKHRGYRSPSLIWLLEQSLDLGSLSLI